MFSTSDTLRNILDAAVRSTQYALGSLPESRQWVHALKRWTISIIAAAKLQ